MLVALEIKERGKEKGKVGASESLDNYDPPTQFQNEFFLHILTIKSHLHSVLLKHKHESIHWSALSQMRGAS